jgi:cell division septation protein DedD
MPSREKKGGGDFVLESRHLVGLFMLLVVIFAVVFTLGYLMGRSQYDARLRAAIGRPPDDSVAASPALKSKAKPQHPETGAGSTSNPPGKDAAQAQKNPDWDFYHSAEPKTTEDHLQSQKKSAAATQPALAKPAVALAKAEAAPSDSTTAGTPLVANGGIMLQVAAVERQSDAMALAQALQQKKFPAFVLTPGADKYYRVQVGPYADPQSATSARHNLEANGFKSIVKR